MRSEDQGTPRLAELLAALSLETDLGLGRPMEHVMRSCLISTRLGERIGLTPEERAEAYYVALLAWVGCMADPTELSRLFGDDIALPADAGRRRRHRSVDAVAADASRRRRGLAATTSSCHRGAPGYWRANACRVHGGQLPGRRPVGAAAGLGDATQRALQQVFARWDGKGMPAGLRRDGIARSVRLLQLADVVETHHRQQGRQAAVEAAVQRRNRLLDPDLVDAFRRFAPEVLPGPGVESCWDEIIDAEPALGTPLPESELDVDLEAIADFTDLKSVYFAAHSREVADLAAAAAVHAGYPRRDVAVVRRAGLLHDLGRSGVPNTIWDKRGPLTSTEWERARLHVYYTERVLARVPALGRAAAIAVAHHERLDASGYHRGTSGAALAQAHGRCSPPRTRTRR